jgi:cardiolipin synthase A/B
VVAGEQLRDIRVGAMMRVLGDMGAYADEVLSRIEHARASVDLECFIIRDDPLGQALARSLARAAARGVSCRLIYDPLGCRSTPRSFFRELTVRGVTVRRYGWLGSALLGRPGARNHARLVIVDGQMAYTGGHAWGREWLPADGGGGGWRDVCCRLEGELATDFFRLFEQHWLQAAGRAGIRDYDSGVRAGAVRLISDAPVKRSLILGRYLEAVSRARQRVWLANAYFYPPPGLLRALTRARRRGVEVKVLVPGTSDLPVIRRAARSQYLRWMADGLDIWEYQDVAMMHAKYALVDDDWCLVGTFNANAVSTAFAIEVAVESTASEAARQVERELCRDFARSHRVDASGLARRNLKDRILDRLAGWFMALSTWILRPQPPHDPGSERHLSPSARGA